MKKTVFAEEGNFMNYEVFSPEQAEKGLPMIVFLHGAGERGRRVEHLARHAIPKLLETGLEVPAVILCPQCPGNCVWDNIPFEVKKLIDVIATEYAVDPARITLTGGSMGGFGTWMLGQTFPNFFAALAPVAGGGMSWRAPNLVHTPIRAFHGECDEQVPVCYSEMMVERVRKAGGDATLTILPGYRHNEGINAAYEQYGIIEWLLSQKREDFSEVLETMSQYF